MRILAVRIAGAYPIVAGRRADGLQRRQTLRTDLLRQRPPCIQLVSRRLSRVLPPHILAAELMLPDSRIVS